MAGHAAAQLSGRRDHQRLQQMLSALTAFTKVHYGRDMSELSDQDEALDGALAAGEQVVGSLRTEHRFRLETLRRLMPRRRRAKVQQ